nr:hypothetical protein [Butyricicoccus sp. GAM44]
MKGSLQKKRDKYYVVVYQKDENGKLRQKWIPTGISSKGRNQTKADAGTAPYFNGIRSAKCEINFVSCHKTQIC